MITFFSYEEMLEKLCAEINIPFFLIEIGVLIILFSE